jgi:hypothetical protein
MMASRNGDGNSVTRLALVANCSTELISLPPRFAIKVGVISPMKRRFFLMIRRRQTPLPDSGYSRSRLPKSEFSASPARKDLEECRSHPKQPTAEQILALPMKAKVLLEAIATKCAADTSKQIIRRIYSSVALRALRDPRPIQRLTDNPFGLLLRPGPRKHPLIKHAHLKRRSLRPRCDKAPNHRSPDLWSCR